MKFRVSKSDRKIKASPLACPAPKVSPAPHSPHCCFIHSQSGLLGAWILPCQTRFTGTNVLPSRHLCPSTCPSENDRTPEPLWRLDGSEPQRAYGARYPYGKMKAPSVIESSCVSIKTHVGRPIWSLRVKAPHSLACPPKP